MDYVLHIIQFITDHTEKIALLASLIVGGITWIREEIKRWRKDYNEQTIEEENRMLVREILKMKRVVKNKDNDNEPDKQVDD